MDTLLSPNNFLSIAFTFFTSGFIKFSAEAFDSLEVFSDIESNRKNTF